jgi:hypothetical protein
MNPVRHIRRLGVALAGLAGALLAFAAAAPGALALPMPSPAPPGLLQHPPVLPSEPGMIEPPAVLPTQLTGPVTGPVHTAVIGGMSGWQIAFIAIGAALLAATITVLLARARATRRNAVTEAT